MCLFYFFEFCRGLTKKLEEKQALDPLSVTMWVWLRAVWHFVPMFLPLMIIQGFTLALLWPFIVAHPLRFLFGGLLILTLVLTAFLLNLLWTIFRNRNNPPPPVDVKELKQE